MKTGKEKRKQQKREYGKEKEWRKRGDEGERTRKEKRNEVNLERQTQIIKWCPRMS